MSAISFVLSVLQRLIMSPLQGLSSSVCWTRCTFWSAAGWRCWWLDWCGGQWTIQGNSSSPLTSAWAGTTAVSLIWLTVDAHEYRSIWQKWSFEYFLVYGLTPFYLHKKTGQSVLDSFNKTQMFRSMVYGIVCTFSVKPTSAVHKITIRPQIEDRNDYLLLLDLLCLDGILKCIALQ